VESNIRSWFKTWTVISIVHKLDAVLDYDKVAVLEAGKLVEFDNPRALLERESLFRDHYLTSVQQRLEGRPNMANDI
jgi:ATP-binding cassette subfamily C (CFTR/MRP) protein 1